MSIKVAELLNVDDRAAQIVYLWDKFYQQKKTKVSEWKELRNYVFATDTSTTSNSSLPWKNKTTLPKLCQIRDNLHSNYLSSLFPNDSWLKWQAYTIDSADREKANAIEGYMLNKTREGGFRRIISKLLYDYIDYGNSFVTVNYESTSKTLDNGETVMGYSGPKAVRISPLDIVFNPLADTFEDSFKIVRSIKTIGEIMNMSEDEPDSFFYKEALAKRKEIIRKMGSYSIEDNDKAEAYTADGFGNLKEYYMSDYVEILEFFGDIRVGDKVERNKIITVMDRSTVVRDGDIPSWLGKAPIYHVGWRTRPDNLWAMGPLDNLVGLQYRIDHLENLKADAMDLVVQPPLEVKGEVEQFRWGPGELIHTDENGGVREVTSGMQGVISAANEIGTIEARMEQYAGAPSEAMGIRTPGEKTAFEVQQLQNKAGRIFQEKITSFETELLENCLNAMLEVAKRNMDTVDVVGVMDDDYGVQNFINVSKNDITALGKIRPIGARHFAAQAQLMQNLNMLMNSPMGQSLAPHMSKKALSDLVSDSLGLDRYQLFKPNVGVFEDAETARLMSQVQEDMEVEQSQEVV